MAHLNTGQYKLHLSEILVEHFSPIREKIEYFLKNREHLEQILTEGSSRAQNIAEQTMSEVRVRVGLRWKLLNANRKKTSFYCIL